MPSISADAGRPGPAGATTRTFTSSARSATARRSMNEPAASPSDLGNECVRHSTFIWSAIRRRDALTRLISASRAELSKLGALRRDHLTEQTGGEEHAANGYAGLDEVHQ